MKTISQNSITNFKTITTPDKPEFKSFLTKKSGSSNKKLSAEKSAGTTGKTKVYNKLSRPTSGTKINFNTKREGSYNYFSSNAKHQNFSVLKDHSKNIVQDGKRRREAKNKINSSFRATRDGSVSNRTVRKARAPSSSRFVKQHQPT